MLGAFRILWLALLASLPLSPALSQVPDLEDIVEVRVLEGWRMSDGRHMAGVEIRLAPGWKTYWRAPGEGGIPPQLELNAGSPRLHWPRPEVFFASGMRSIGYRGDVIFPIELRLPAGTQDVRGALAIGVCREVCMPVSIPIAAAFPDGGRPDPRIVAAMSDRPMTPDEAGAGTVTCRLSPIADGMRIEAQVTVAETGNDETVVFELPDPSIWISEAATERQGSTIMASADIVPADASPFALDRGSVRMTVLGSRMAVEFQGCTAG